MTKKASAICILVLCIGMLIACSGKKATPTEVNVAVLRGPTAIGIMQLMDEVDNGRIDSNNYSIEIAGSVDEIVPQIVQGTIDIAAVPANLAAILYNNTEGAVQVLAVHTLGMVYIVEQGETINSVLDLRGKTIIASGKGVPQEYALNYILRENGLDPDQDLNIEWKSEHTEVVAALMSGTASIAMLPQPFVTTAIMSDESIRIALDINEEWDRIQDSSTNQSSLIMGVMIARADFIKENPDAVADFLDRYAESIDYANNSISETAGLVEHYGIFTEAVAQRAIPYCNITFIEGREMMERFSGFLRVLYEQNPQSIGGALPSEEFYFSR